MTPHTFATIIELAIGAGGGLLASLVGFRVIGPKTGTNANYDALHVKWLKHLRWVGPLTVLFAGVLGVVSL